MEVDREDAHPEDLQRHRRRDLDDEVEREANQTISEIFENSGEGRFRELETKALKSCAYLQNTIVACGGGTPCFFDNMQWMNEHGVTIYIEATPEEILNRLVSEQDKRPLVKKLNKIELLVFIEEKIKERAHVYLRAKRVLQAAQLTENSFKEIISSHYIP